MYQYLGGGESGCGGCAMDLAASSFRSSKVARLILASVVLALISEVGPR